MAFTAVPFAGARLRASVLSALVTELRPVSVAKAVTTPRASTTAKTADPELVIALPANSVWDFELMLLLSSDANAAGDFAADVTHPSGSTVSIGSVGLVASLASGSSADLQAGGISLSSTSPTGGFQLGTSTTPTAQLLVGRITIGATAGDLALSWAQVASNASATNVHGGSTLVARRAA